MYMDYTYILVLIGAIISGLASLNVKSTFKKYSRIRSARNISGHEAAEQILHSAGIYDVRIERVRGSLTDHYAPGEKVLRLSESVYDDTSVAAIGVAAHECGHAIQHQQGYSPIKLRSVAVPVANIGSKLSWPVLILGVVFGLPQLAQIGVWLFVFVVFFQLITLPVEFNASHRALVILDKSGMLGHDEVASSRKVLTAAALTYVAALFSAVLQLFRMILISQGKGRRR